MRTSKSRHRKTSSSLKASSKIGKKKRKKGKEKIEKKQKKESSYPPWWGGEITEYVDWIDEKGKVIGIVSKKFAHDFGLLHHAEHVFVVNEKGELAIQKRSKNMRTLPGKWDTSVGGHPKSGETLSQGVKREAKEELGISVSPKKLGWMDIADKTKDYTNWERVTFYVSRTNQKVKRQKSELAGVKWIPVKNVDAFITKNKKNCGPMFVKGWEKFGKKIAKMG